MWQKSGTGIYEIWGYLRECNGIRNRVLKFILILFIQCSFWFIKHLNLDVALIYNVILMLRDDEYSCPTNYYLGK